MPQWFFVEVGDGGLDIASRFWRFVIVFKENQMLETDLRQASVRGRQIVTIVIDRRRCSCVESLVVFVIDGDLHALF